MKIMNVHVANYSLRAPLKITVGLHVQDLFMKIIFWLQDGRRRATAAKCPVGIDFDPGLRGVLATMVGEPPEGRSRQNGP